MASVLACAFSLAAQITTTLNRLPAGLDEVRIRNNSATSLVAFVVSVKQAPRSSDSPPVLDLGASNAPFVVYSDPLIEPGARPLQASEERVATVSGVVSFRQTRLLEDSVVAAGILADGTTTGDAALLTRLLSRRSNMLQAVEMALTAMCHLGSLLESRTHSPARGMDGPEDEGPPAATLEASTTITGNAAKQVFLGSVN